MANHKSAKKRIRQNAVRRLRNRYQHVSTRTAIKNLKGSTEKEAATLLLPGVVSKVDKCVRNNIFHKNKGSRIKSQLTRYVNGLD